MFCGVSDLVGGMSDTCGDNGVTVSAGGWDSVGRGCEAIALLASGSLVGPVAIDMSVGGLSDGTAGSGAALRDGAGGLLWTALESVPRSGAAMPGAVCGLSAVAADDWGVGGISAAGMARTGVLLNACRSEPLLLSVARVIGVLPLASLSSGSAP